MSLWDNMVALPSMLTQLAINVLFYGTLLPSRLKWNLKEPHSHEGLNAHEHTSNFVNLQCD